MIVYLNFAPIDFVGGAELWLRGISKATSKHEETYVISVASTLSDMYGQIVLNRKFSENRTPEKMDNVNLIELDISSFTPFSKNFREVKSLLKKARLIYIKLELLEVVITIYFVGFSALKKTIGGVHSPLQYTTPKTFFSKLHNFIYSSVVYGFIIRRLNKIHVLNKNDLTFLKTKYNSKNIIQMYDGVDMKKNEILKTKMNNAILKIIIVGELSLRKGTDILIKIIKNSPKNFFFTIIGDGPLRKSVTALSKKYNYDYIGYLHDKKKLNQLYKEHDVLLFPSRAETQGLVMPEAMNFGLKIVNSAEVNLGAPKFAELSSNTDDPEEYVKLLNQVFTEKMSHQKIKEKIHEYAYKEFSNDILQPKFLSKILLINN